MRAPGLRRRAFCAHRGGSPHRFCHPELEGYTAAAPIFVILSASEGSSRLPVRHKRQSSDSKHNPALILTSPPETASIFPSYSYRFSPAGIATFNRFSRGACGHVAKGEYAQGGLTASLKSSVTIPGRSNP